jgi:hypothetical protein
VWKEVILFLTSFRLSVWKEEGAYQLLLIANPTINSTPYAGFCRRGNPMEVITDCMVLFDDILLLTSEQFRTVKTVSPPKKTDGIKNKKT